MAIVVSSSVCIHSWLPIYPESPYLICPQIVHNLRLVQLYTFMFILLNQMQLIIG